MRKHEFVTGKLGGRNYITNNPEDRLDFLHWWIEFLNALKSDSPVWKGQLLEADCEFCELSDFLGRPVHKYFPRKSIFNVMP